MEGEVRAYREDCCQFGAVIVCWVLESRISGGRGWALCEQLLGPESSRVENQPASQNFSGLAPLFFYPSRPSPFLAPSFPSAYKNAQSFPSDSASPPSSVQILFSSPQDICSGEFLEMFDWFFFFLQFSFAQLCVALPWGFWLLLEVQGSSGCLKSLNGGA